MSDRIIKLATYAVTASAAVALTLVVWFAFPLIAFAGIAPFESAWFRLALIITIWALMIGILAYRHWQGRRAQAALEAAIAVEDKVADDSEQLAERMNDALATLRKASSTRNFLYDLPWYVIIGPPGTGKTTALVNSGLKFPLAAHGQHASIAGVGGTRYCDWWFAEEAVLIDTAGRYTTQDSDEKSDRKSWLSFLSLLKTQRPKQPLNGVIIAISLEDIMTLSAEELNAHAVAIRKRLLELHQELKVDFPVYALFTKADLIAGFNEFFSAFTEDRRRQVWGATFQSDDRKKNFLEHVPSEIDDLVMRLTEETADRLQAEPDPMARISVFGFPAQIAALRDPIVQFLGAIFEPTRYHSNAQLRGFYFSSGTQQGTPIDQMLGKMETNFGTQTAAMMSGRGKSYFLHDLLTKVVFQEAGWVSRDMSAVRRAASIRYAGIAAMLLATVTLSIAWIWAYATNRQLITATNAAIAEYRTIGGPALNAEPVSDTDLHTVLDLLHKLRNMETGYANGNALAGRFAGFGLGQTDRLRSASEEAYRQALERTFRSRLVLRVEQQIEANINDPMFVYEALKVYLMLGGKAPKPDNDLIVDWMQEDWANNLYPGAGNKAGRDELEQHLLAMLALDDVHNPEIALNGSLVSAAQQTLARLSLADRAYTLIRGAAQAQQLEAWSLVARGGPDSALVFETVDGSPIDTLEVSGFFTYAGFHQFFLDQLGTVAEKLQAEQWVLGTSNQQSTLDAQISRLGPELLERYRREFIAAWESTLGRVRLKRMSADKPEYVAIQAAAGASSPIRGVFESISEETRLTEERSAPVKEDPSAPGTAEMVRNAVIQRIQSRTSGWSRIGIDIALSKSQNRPGTPQSATAAPGSNIQAYFRAYHQLVEGEPGRRSLDTLIANLNDISQSLILALTPSQTQRATANLQVQIASLKSNVSRLPPTLAKMMQSAVSDFEGDAAGSTIAQLNQELNVRVTRACQEITANRYPFSPTSDRDVPIAEFTKLFAPNGAIDRFFSERLSPLVDVSKPNWDWNQGDRLGQELSRATLREFQRAAQIRDAFFPSGAPMLSLQMVVKPQTLSGNADFALFELNGNVIQSQQVGNAPVSLTWPGTGAGSASISIFPELPGRSSHIAANGPWALMRLLAMGSISGSAEAMAARFVIGGREVSYRIELGATSNPFLLPALADFKCPAGF
ncbi:type VI secretion system membrane subunit TssM [Rhizobium sp. CSW-27]|uniref:type VI secretion system membrane subunit TssM n=1 Tax=Rhizobium sp. CSW-27 TaxID=2839985 RepID=UPI001C0314AC|nr:type VI secretion system membrane subunit TssM [Rhizobium sp. CSW-27]MBT9373084.1 type VI secretion system membrane subunit TssM [Rhizobium sp. CSW-27]